MNERIVISPIKYVYNQMLIFYQIGQGQFMTGVRDLARISHQVHVKQAQDGARLSHQMDEPSLDL
jgi:hypothetical protein